MSLWEITETATGKKQSYTSFEQFTIQEAYLKGMGINYSVAHNGEVKKVTFSRQNND